MVTLKKCLKLTMLFQYFSSMQYAVNVGGTLLTVVGDVTVQDWDIGKVKIMLPRGRSGKLKHGSTAGCGAVCYLKKSMKCKYIRRRVLVTIFSV